MVKPTIHCDGCGSDHLEPMCPTKKTTSWTGTNRCPKCGKPYCYVGDVPEGGFPKGQEPYCTCNQEVTPIFHQYGWICPVCSRVNAPDVRSCPCSDGTLTYRMSA